MENEKLGDSKIGIVQYILSRKEGQQFLAACLIVIVVLSGVIVVLWVKNDRLYRDKTQIIIKSDERLIDFMKAQNDDLIRLKNQVDSAKTQLELFKIKKEMR